MSELETIAGWLNDEYNYALTTYVYDRDGFVRLTNGSAAHYVDIYPDGETFRLGGERYGETVDKECDADKDVLLDTLAKTI